MMMLMCPSCGTEMARRSEQDLALDECPECGGIFLAAGELNLLATGLSGDIEYCSIDDEFHKDRFGTRNCPYCLHETMRKINLLRLSEIIFDYCPTCSGIFLDRGELDAMNAELAGLSRTHAAEKYRAMHAGHLVRVDHTSSVMPMVTPGGLGTRFTEVQYLRISVSLQPPLPVPIRIFRESWPVRLAKALRLFSGDDISTGDKLFDETYRVQGDDPKRVRACLTPLVRESLIRFAHTGPSIYTQRGALEVSSTTLVYVEGPYAAGSVTAVVESSQPVRDALLSIAEHLHSARPAPGAVPSG